MAIIKMSSNWNFKEAKLKQGTTSTPTSMSYYHVQVCRMKVIHESVLNAPELVVLIDLLHLIWYFMFQVVDKNIAFEFIVFGIASISEYLPHANPLQVIFFQSLACRSKHIADFKILSEFQLEEFDLPKAKGHHSKWSDPEILLKYEQSYASHMYSKIKIEFINSHRSI